MAIDSASELREMYGYPNKRATLKQLDYLDKHAKHFLSLSPFMVLSTVSKHLMLDTSPRGGEPGFVKLDSNDHLLLPDAKGNNRLDSLMNILENPTVGCLFFIPGVDETLRINGHATLVNDEPTLKQFNHLTHKPNCVIKIKAKKIFLHCAKALMRSQLWSVDSHINRAEFPTMGQMLKDQLNDEHAAESQDDMIKRYSRQL